MHFGLAKVFVAIAMFYGLVGSARSPFCSATIAETPTSTERVDEGYAATDETADFRVTLLGITKGVSFLKTPDPVGDGGRESGNHPVRWMRVAALVEELGEKQAAPNLRAETAEGDELVDKMAVEAGDNTVTMRARGTQELDLDFAYLAPHIFPVAPPALEAPRNAKAFVYTLSGDFRPTEAVTLRFQFGPPDDRQELVFPGVPIP